MNMEGHDTGPGKPGREDLAPETNIVWSAPHNLRRGLHRRLKRASIRSRVLRNRRGTYRDECCRDWNHSSRICFAENVRDQARQQSETTRLVSNVVGHLKDGVNEQVLGRAIEYWRNIDKTVGEHIARGVKGERNAAE